MNAPPVRRPKLTEDPIPQIRAAGKILALGDERADHSIRAGVHLGEPSTPEHLKRFRKTQQNQPGVRQVHPGQAFDRPKVEGDHAFGKKTFGSEHVDEVIKAQNLAGLAERFNDIKENKYASNVKEPLAKGFERGYQWPGQTQDQQFKFGVPTLGSESAKDVLYPLGAEKEERSEIAHMYKKTHGNFGPGEQRNRAYNMPVDVKEHRFGYGEKRLLEGAAMSVHAERHDQGFPKTVIVKKTVEDQKAVTQDQLGQVKNLGQGRPPVGSDHAFGVRNVQGEGTWNAAACIHGDPSERELAPDNDLGKSVKPGVRNVVRKPEDVDRVFGVPTIRTDIPYKEKRSVADHQNYGDEAEAVDLLFPSTFQELGISEYDFQVPRPSNEIRELFQRIGFSYKVGKFNAMFNRAKTLTGHPEWASVRAFMQAVQEMHHIE